ncbi:MAG TPA: helix-turn-helix transcriptional regulator [Solirubrobacterales bacterium]|nr:helix-turn-helix transcriptional regulator [Solirubrobacterales bacterium]
MPARSKAHAALGRAIKEIREQKELTQVQVAQRMDAPSTFISDLERGVRNPSWSTLLGLAKALGVKPSEIAKRAGQ